MMQIMENEDDDYEPRFSNGSMSCLFAPLSSIDSPRSSISYNKLHQQPLRLSVRKLDGSSFGIEVAKTAMVGELKRAVEAAFNHLPKKGPGSVSWQHVWGQFCLCHEGQKLLSDSDCIRMFGIKDGDQLQFIRHASTTYNLVKIEKADSDLVNEHCVSDGHKDGQKNSEKNDHQIEIVEDNHDDHAESDGDLISHCKYRLTQLLRGWFPYRKLANSDMAIEEMSSSPRFPSKMLGSFKNCLRCSSNKYEPPRDTWKGH